jgi:hypothetical protein
MRAGCPHQMCLEPASDTPRGLARDDVGISFQTDTGSLDLPKQRAIC